MSLALKLSDLPRYTAEDYERWEGRWELIHGVPYAMSPSPTFWHQRLSARLAALLEEALAGCAACRHVVALDWRVADGTVVCPDHAVVCGDMDGACITRPPALVVEILSPSTARNDRGLKFDLYEAEGVRHYLVVDLDAGRVEAYAHDGVRYAERRDATAGPLPLALGPRAVTLDVGRLWAA